MAQPAKPTSSGGLVRTSRSASHSSLQVSDSPPQTDSIEIFPPEVIIKDIECDQTYEVTICVRNLSKKVRRIRFTPPKTSKFIAQYETVTALAIGMRLNVVVTFETDQLGDFHDELWIRMEGLKTPIQVPLHAFQKRPEIIFDPYVNLGFTIVNKPIAGKVSFKNEGSLRAELRIIYDKQLTPELSVIPSEFTLEPDEDKDVALSYVSKEVNTFRCVLEVEVEGQDVLRHIDVNANCVEQQLVLVAPSLEKLNKSAAEPGPDHLAVTSSINFGTMYHGQSRHVEAFLVNVGPFPAKYVIKFVQGSEDEVESDNYLLMTPQELATQSIKRAFDATPITGLIPPFSQAPIKFLCASKRMESAIGFIHSMMKKEKTGEDVSSSQVLEHEASYFYTALFNFAEMETKLTVQLQARAIFPHVELSHTSVHFYECPVHEHRDFLINMENQNDELPLDFSFSHIAHFAVEPIKGILLPHQAKAVIVTFKPGNFGTFENTCCLTFLDGAYNVPIKLYGQSSTIGVKPKTCRGPESTRSDFAPPRTFVSEDEIARHTQVTPKQWLADTFPTRFEATDMEREVDNVIMQQTVRQHYNDFLKESRQKRLRTAHMLKRVRTEMTLHPTIEELKANVDLTLHTAPPRSRKLQLPINTDGLVVDKPIGKYDNINLKVHAASHDPDKPVKNFHKRLNANSVMEEFPFYEQPVRHQDIKECSGNLGPFDMRLISAGPRELKFGEIVIRSEVYKWFSVVNDLKQHIFVELSSTAEEVNRIEPESLVIPPGLKGGFKVTLMSAKKHRIERTVKYTINGKYEFHFMVLAEVEPAVLDILLPDQTLAPSQIPFLFFKFEEDNMDESLNKQVIVINRSPAPGKFSWQTPPNSNFEIDPREDIVEALKQKIVVVKFVPGLTSWKNEEETLVLKVENGENQGLLARGEVTEARCAFMQKNLDFGIIAVGIKAEKLISIKNSDPKNAIFHVKKYPNQMTVAPMRGRIAPEAKFPLKVILCTMFEEELNGELEVMVRGGKSTLRLQVHATSIIPKVYIQEPDIDFGGVTVSSTLTRRFTLVNESPIQAVLYLNLEDHPEFDISVPLEDDIESSILIPATNDKESPFYLKEDDDDADDPKPDPLMNEEESEDEEIEEIHRKFKITVPGSKSISLILRFSPKDTEPYEFSLPIVLAGVNQTIPGLLKTVNGEGIKPRFIVEPAILKFKNKVISSDKNFASVITTLLSNPEASATRWRLDTSAFEKDLVFSMKPNEGTLESGIYANVRVSFNPVQAIVYEERVNLYLNDSSDPYMTLTLQGEGTVPRVVFDRREVILPIVPLNIPAKANFIIINDGYENVELNPYLPQDAGEIQLTLTFPDGHQLGVTKEKMNVEVSFISSRPVSFTTKVDFIDLEGKKYSIPISGTADNCLLTVFPFIQRNPDEIRFETIDNGPITLVQDVESDMEMYSEHGKSGGHRTSGGSSVVSHSARSIIGFSPIPQPLLEQSLDFLTRWLNHSVLSSPINKLPDDFIETHGAQVYELVFGLTGKYPPGQVKNFAVPAREMTRLLIDQYTELINYLKTNGAMLNTIRPEYLLSITEFTRFLKSTPNQLQLRQRQVERRWPYLSMDSWITLLYQIIKVFILNRTNPKTFKALPGILSEKATIEAYMRDSNVYSLAENILLKWMSYHYGVIYSAQHRRLTNFDSDLMDGTVVGAVIQNHVGLIGSLLKIKPVVVNDEHKKNNVEKVLAALGEIGMPSFLTQKDLTISSVSAREMVLFCLSLYQSLPHYIPKCTIEFPGALGETVTKNIELSNPANKQVTYWVKLEGNSDFILTNPNEFSIPPKGNALFPIKFTSRLSSEVKANLRFTSRASEGSAHAAAMVFLLVSKVLSRKSEKSIEVTASLYELGAKDIEITNPYAKDGEFSIQIVYPEQLPIPSSQARTRRLSHNTAAAPEQIITFPKAFFIKTDRVKIKKNGMNIVSLMFMPFDTEKVEAYLIFTDENVGEMQYTVVGLVTPPKVDKLDRLDAKGEVGEVLSIPVPISAKNHQFVRAKQESLQRLNGASKNKERELLKEIFRVLENEETGVFDVDIDSPFFTAPPTITITDAIKNKGKGGNLDVSRASNTETGKAESIVASDAKGKKRLAPPGAALRPAVLDKGGNVLNLALAPRQPGEYICRITISNSRKTDIRRLEVIAQIKPRKARITLEMTAQARSAVTQEIPIVNNSDKEWTVKTKLMQEGDFFAVSKDLQVKKKGTGNVIVTFRPEWVCEAKAKLDLDIPASGEMYEFELIGYGEEPCAEEHYEIKCRVKERSKHYITVPNPRTYPVTYRVVSDVMNATGEAMLDVPAGGSADYELTMYPLQSGTYTGSITFYDPQNRFYWYTLEVQAATPEPEAVKELKVQCRKAMEFRITVYNPLPDETLFDVNVLGEGLFGEPQFLVAGRETGIYQLLYTPLVPGEGEGSVSFISEKTGEFWYYLHLICEPAEPIEKETFECDLGKSVAKQITLENPSGKEVVLDYSCTNGLNFELIPDKVILPPFGSIEALIKYTPTSLKFIETAEIRLSSRQVGDWVFLLKGKGLPPTEMEPLIVTASIGESNSMQVPFRNPFRDMVSVNVILETSTPEIFQLLLRRSKFSVSPLGILLIPFGFQPQSMEECSASLIVSITEELTWRFPLRGITERPSTKLDFVFRTKCRVALEKEIDIQLHDLGNLPEEENFTHELAVSNPELSSIVNKSFKLDPLKNILSDPTDPLRFKVKFEPLRPFKTEAELFIYKGSGGRWRYNVLIEAQSPDIDDTITIEAPMFKETSVSFHLCNHFKQYASFTAFFTEDSDPSFKIQPEKGILEPYGREGTQFIVSYTPTEYGAPKIATLVVLSDDMQWSYTVKGTHPQYKRPDIGGGRVDNRLSKATREAVQTARGQSRKNFIKENISGSKKSPKRGTTAGTKSRPMTTR